jgi:CheY-like chemotaxis protein
VTLRILVVDDSAAFRRTVQELLSARGLTLFAAVGDGAAAIDAIDAVAGGCPDAAFVDVNLPGPDGFAVAAALAARCPRIRTVLISSDVDSVSPAELARCGALAFVPKTGLVEADLGALLAG